MVSTAVDHDVGFDCTEGFSLTLLKALRADSLANSAAMICQQRANALLG